MPSFLFAPSSSEVFASDQDEAVVVVAALDRYDWATGASCTSKAVQLLLATRIFHAHRLYCL